MPGGTYLGDGVSADSDGLHIVLTADGTRRVYLDPGVFAALLRYADRISFPGSPEVERLRELLERSRLLLGAVAVAAGQSPLDDLDDLPAVVTRVRRERDDARAALSWVDTMALTVGDPRTVTDPSPGPAPGRR